jgi:hypothetical protein
MISFGYDTSRSAVNTNEERYEFTKKSSIPPAGEMEHIIKVKIDKDLVTNTGAPRF